MTIVTKFNIGDIKWIYSNGYLIKGEIKDIKFIRLAADKIGQYSIFYDIRSEDSYIIDIAEDEIFESKQHIVDTLKTRIEEMTNRKTPYINARNLASITNGL